MSQYGGKPRPPKPPKPTFCDMVQDAIADELGAVAMYATMAGMVSDPTLKMIILSIANDEACHARTWMTIYTLMCTSDC